MPVRLLSLCFALAIVLPAIAQDERESSTLEKLDPRRIPAASKPKTLPDEVLAVLDETQGRMDCLAFRPDGKFMAVSGPEGIVRLYDLATLKSPSSMQHNEILCLAFSPNGKLLAAGDSKGNLRLWNVSSVSKPALVGDWSGHRNGPVWSLAFAPDGETLASGGADHEIKLWNLSGGKQELKSTLSGHQHTIRSLAFSPDGKLLASAGFRDNTVKLWELPAGKVKHSLEMKGSAMAVAFSPDGKMLLTGDMAKFARVWKLDGDEPFESLRIDMNGGVAQVAFTSDGKAVVGLVKFDFDEDKIVVWGLDQNKRYESMFARHIEAMAPATDARHVALVTEMHSTWILRLPE